MWSHPHIFSLFLSHTHTHMHTHAQTKPFIQSSTPTLLLGPILQYCAPKPFRGAASRKMTPCCPRSSQSRLVTPVSQGPAEGPTPLGLPLTPLYLPGPNVNGVGGRRAAPWTMAARKRGKEMSQGSLTTKVRPPDLRGWSHWASLCKQRVSKEKKTLR